MSWYDEGQSYSGDQRSVHHFDPQSYSNQQQGQHGSTGEMTRLEALQLIGEIGQEGQQQSEERVAAPPARSRKRSRSRRSRSSRALDEDETDAPASKKGSKKVELEPEYPNNAAYKATNNRKHLRAEIMRAYGIGVGHGLSKADREALLSEQNHGNSGAKKDDDGSDSGGDGEEEGGNENNKSDAQRHGDYLERLPVKDEVPFCPLFSSPSEHLDRLYDEVESILEDREETWSAVEDAFAELQDARQRLRDALEVDAQMKIVLEEVKDRARAAEMEEPCWWNDMLQKLREFHEAYGHCKVPNFMKVDREEDPGMYELARFDLALKDRYRRGTLQRYPHRVKAVEDLGFKWGLQKGVFEGRLEKLRNFKLKHGHCEVSLTDDKDLSTWVAGIRARHRKRTSGKIGVSGASRGPSYEKKIAKIRDIVGGEDAFNEWIFRVRVRGRGRQRVEEIRVHRQRTGHCVHPDPGVRSWMMGIRARYDRKKRGQLCPSETLSDDLVDALSEMGFCWTSRCTCQNAPKDQYLSDDESNEVGGDETDNAGGWETGAEDGGQRSTCSPRKKDKRTRRQRLASQRHSDVAWGKWIEKLKLYKAQNGNCLVKRADDEKLHDWLRAAQRAYKEFQRGKETGGNEEIGAETDYPQTDAEDNKCVGSRKVITTVPMTETRASELEEAMGNEINATVFTPKGNKPTFMTMFKKWSEHKEKEGNCKHPDEKVWRWITKCRMRRKLQLKLLENPNALEEEKEEQMEETERGTAPDTEEAEELPKRKRKRKKYRCPPLTQEQFELLDNAGLCWCRSCVCNDPKKKAALSLEKEGFHLGNTSFDEHIAIFREHRKKTGHCIHPNEKMRAWFGHIKGQRRATLEKRARDAEGKGKGTSDKEDDVGEVNELKKGVEPAEKLPPAGEYKPLSDEKMAKLEGLGACWGWGCKCPRPSQPKPKNRAEKDMPPIDSMADITYDWPFDDMLAFFVVNRSVNGRCYSYYPEVQQWYQNVKARYLVYNRKGKATLTDMHITALEDSSICLGRCKCRGKKIDNLGLAQQGTKLIQGQDKEEETPVTKTVADLDPSELEKLAAEVVNRIRLRDCWSSDECSSDESLSDESSSGDESRDESFSSRQGGIGSRDEQDKDEDESV